MIKYFIHPLTALAFMAATSATVLPQAQAQAQDKALEQTYVFEAGQVIDFLFLTRRPNSEEALIAYARAAISEARALDYKGLGGFNITRRPTQGNYYPESLIFGGWPGGFDDRVEVLAQLKEMVPDLYERRLDVWSRFDMTNYQLDEDKSFTVRRDKIQVLTAYWQKDGAKFDAFKQEFLMKAKATGGVVKLELTDPRSPFWYDYTPEYTVIAEWDNQAAFDVFLKQNLAMDHSGIKHVNQFYLMPPAPKS